MTEIKNVICHKLDKNKKMLKIKTHTGIVVCTSDHSLVNSLGMPIKPDELNVGDELMQSFQTLIQTIEMINGQLK